MSSPDESLDHVAERGGAARPPRGGRAGSGPPGVEARRIALEALGRIDDGGAYANLVVPSILDRSGLQSDDRGLVTDLVYGTTRMRRACDAAVDRFLVNDPEPVARRALRMGAYQLLFRGVPPHAAVSATVGAVPKRARGFVNAVLRRVADAGPDISWPDDATRLSYPDWVVERLIADLGHDDALGALAAMNEPPTVHRREDGYVQDRASEWVVDLVGAGPGEVVLDLCAAPGGKTTGLAAAGAWVAAGEIRASRAGLLAGNVRRYGQGRVAVVVADATHPPFASGVADRVLVDAPCSGLGALRHRPDARWRIEADAVERLAEVQRRLLDEAVRLLRPGGLLVYSVCTLTSAETIGVDGWLAEHHPDLEVDDAPLPEPWQRVGRGARVLPQAADTDGMYVLRARVGHEE